MPPDFKQFPAFDNAFLRALPGDPEPRNFVRQVEGAAWSAVAPTPVAAPRLLAHSAEMARELGFSEDDLASPDFAAVVAGNTLLPGSQPFASNYGGHQFGNWAGQLGDGRARAPLPAAARGTVMPVTGSIVIVTVAGLEGGPPSVTAYPKLSVRSPVGPLWATVRTVSASWPTARSSSRPATSRWSS